VADKKEKAPAAKRGAKAAEKPAKAPVKKAAPAAKAAPKARARKPQADKPQAEKQPAKPQAPADLSKAEVVNVENKKVREVPLSPEVFGGRVNTHLLYEAVKQYRAGGRRGTHMTKNRALVSGTGKKPWKQKGTGRARVGEARNPLWRHGGTVFGPTPRDYSYDMPKKARAAALRSALTQRLNEGAFLIIDSFPVEAPKTRILRGILDKLGVVGKAVLVDHEPTDNLILSGRNIPGLKVVAVTHLTVYDVLDCRHLLVSQEALGKLEERLTP
jgi:large subunit ribosomal protein L4